MPRPRPKKTLLADDAKRALANRIDPLLYDKESALELLEFIESGQLARDDIDIHYSQEATHGESLEELSSDDHGKSQSIVTASEEAGGKRAIRRSSHTRLNEDFKENKLGDHGQIKDVTQAASLKEFFCRVSDYEMGFNPWRDQSVRDQIELTHVEGHHAPNQFISSIYAPKIYPFSDPSVGESWVKPYHSFYEAISADQSAGQTIMQLALEDNVRKFTEERNMGKRYPFKPSQSIHENMLLQGGTFLKEFDDKNFELRIADALKFCASRFPSPPAILLTTAAIDPYKTERARLGGDEAVDMLAGAFVEFAKKLRRDNFKLEKSLLDWDADLVDACHVLNVPRVIGLLLRGADANVVVNDESVFVVLVDEGLRLELLVAADNEAAEETVARTRSMSSNLQNKNRAIAPVSTLQHRNSRVVGRGQSSVAVDVSQTTEFKNRARYAKVLKVLGELVKFGAAIDTPGVDGFSPLHRVAVAGSLEMLQWLMTQGADINVRCGTAAVTALMLAAMRGHVRSLAVLLRAACSGDYGPAASRADRALIPRLGATHLGMRDKAGWTALHYAAYYGQVAAAMFLLQVGANKYTEDEQGFTAGALGASRGHRAISQLISAFATENEYGVRANVAHLTFVAEKTDAAMAERAAKPEEPPKPAPVVNSRRGGVAGLALRVVFSGLRGVKKAAFGVGKLAEAGVHEISGASFRVLSTLRLLFP